MLKKIALALLLIVLTFAGYVAMQPAVGTVTRSATISAPPSAVFPYVNDLHKWQDWSPWAKLDPNAKVTFEGPEAGTGAATTGRRLCPRRQPKHRHHRGRKNPTLGKKCHVVLLVA